MQTADEILYGTGSQGTANPATPADAILHGSPEVKQVAPQKAPGKDGASEGDQMLKALQVGFGTSAGRSFLWQMANTPLAKAPTANLDDLPDITFTVPSPGGSIIPVNPRIAGAVYNATKGLLEGATTPLSIATMRVGGPLASLAKEYPAAKAAVVGMAGGFTYMMGKGTKEAFDNRQRVMDDPNASFADKVQANLEVVTSGLMTVLSAFGTVEALHPQVLTKLEGKTPQEATHILASEAQDAKTPEAKAALINAADALHEAAPQPAPVLPEPVPVKTVPDAETKTPPEPTPQESAALEAMKEPSVSGAPKEEPPKPAQETPPTDDNLVGIKNAAIDAAMKDMGLDPGEHGETTTAKTENVKARAILDADPNAGRRLVEEITKKPRPLTPTEDFVLLNEMNRLAIERRSASAALEAAQKAGDPIAIQNARVRSAQARDDYIAAGNAADVVGTVNAQALALRRSMIREDYSLAEMERTLSEATKDGKLTPDQDKKVAKSQKRIEKAQTDLEKHDAARLKAYKTRKANEIAELKRRVAEGDTSPKPKPEPVKLDAEGEKLRTEHERAKQEFQEMVAKTRLEGRSLSEKAQGALVQWVRGLQLTRLATLAKLSMSAAYRTIGTPAEEAVGAGIEHMPFMGRIAAMAPRQGGLNIAAEAHALTEGITKGMQDSLQTLKTGQSDLDVMYGKGKDSAVGESDVMPRSMVEFLGSVWHSVIKAPIKRMEFTRSFDKRIAWKATQGIDVHNPMVQAQTVVESYRDANRSVFLQDNALVDAYKRFLSRFEQVDKATGRAPLRPVATAAKVLMPFVRVPTNVIAETVEYAFGTATGSAKVAAAYASGIDKLTPEQADVIMRLMKKGSIGAVSLTLGYMNYKSVGGLFQPGVRRTTKETPYGAINVMGENVPSYLLEHPALNALQVGATVHHVQDEKMRQSDREGQDFGTAIMFSILGLGEEIPLARGMENMTKMLGGSVSQKKAAIGDTIKNAVVPGIVQEAANKTDEDSRGNTIKRKQSTIMEHVQSGIPLWRENLKRDIDHSER